MTTAIENTSWANLDHEQKRRNRAKKILIGLLAVILAVTAVVSYLIASIVSDNNLAWQTCQEKVAERAKYPGGVEFAGLPEEETEYLDNDYFYYSAYGEVDFVNGFGTPVRHGYRCSVLIKDGEVSNHSALVFENPILSARRT